MLRAVRSPWAQRRLVETGGEEVQPFGFRLGQEAVTARELDAATRAERSHPTGARPVRLQALREVDHRVDVDRVEGLGELGAEGRPGDRLEPQGSAVVADEPSGAHRGSLAPEQLVDP
jgi:hypothetical protein